MGVTSLVFTDPGTPDTRGPLRYLYWLGRRQPRRVLTGTTLSTVWMVLLMVPPYLVSRAIDDGVRARDTGALLGWAGAVLGAGVTLAVLGTLRHRTMTMVRTDGLYRTVRVLTRRVVELGPALPRQVAAGEVVAIGSADIMTISHVLTVFGPGVGAVFGYTAVAVALLGISPLLAAVVLLGVPLLVVSIGPLLRRLQQADARYRGLQGELTARAGDIVAGLRVLCGIGGKDLFAGRYRDRSRVLRAEGYRVGAVTSWIQALAVGMPLVFLAVVTWLAARMAAAHTITVGELVAVYGYVAVLITPVSFLIESADDLGRALVSTRRVLRVLTLTEDIPDHGTRPGPRGQADLHDPVSGVRVPAGSMVALVATRPGDAVAVLDRLGRFTDSAATWGGTPLTEIALDEVRRRILVADNDAYLFAGPVRAVIGGGDVRPALRIAAAEDVVEALPDGLDSVLDDQARTVSGGQRQRLRLARAVHARPDVLLLVEPTSAVDAHTESLIATRLHADRQGRTTVVAATSPQLLARADHVIFLSDGTVAATGSHAELVRTQPRYRGLVLRGDEDVDQHHVVGDLR
ncbi:ABC transporter ATP-binding protein [Labedaea rhizosphaerae]|nr:ABC transporter ATP-binding protein [Labedaea rhizosphaerae]